jgi:hypothetical protein
MKKATATSQGSKRVLAAAGAGPTVDGMDASRELIRKVNQERLSHRNQEFAIRHNARSFDALTPAGAVIAAKIVEGLRQCLATSVGASRVSGRGFSRAE